ncbi:hypothetical protein PIB30_066743 [Stylosanthes scabra]|uniref:Transmembrane protein n=1 Tax=Stylosanthes scabra TaxID=79078 RepID=A0ABU6VKY7_9FABA|nr:hypothetical protein [Stylosanthes scabra]
MRLDVGWRRSCAAPSRAISWFCIPPVFKITVVVPEAVIFPNTIFRVRSHKGLVVREIILFADTLFSSIFFYGILLRILFVFLLNLGFLWFHHWILFVIFFHILSFFYHFRFWLRVTIDCNDFLYLGFLEGGTTYSSESLRSPAEGSCCSFGGAFACRLWIGRFLGGRLDDGMLVTRVTSASSYEFDTASDRRAASLGEAYVGGP